MLIGSSCQLSGSDPYTYIGANHAKACHLGVMFPRIRWRVYVLLAVVPVGVVVVAGV